MYGDLSVRMHIFKACIILVSIRCHVGNFKVNTIHTDHKNNGGFSMRMSNIDVLSNLNLTSWNEPKQKLER